MIGPTHWLARWWKPLALLVAAALVAAFALAQLDAWRAARDAQRWERQLRDLATRHAADSVRAVRAERTADSLRASYRADTVRLTRTVTQYRDRVRTLPAPVSPAETVYVAALSAADTAIRACQQAVRTCEQRVAAAESVGVARLQQLRTDSAAGSVLAALRERAAADRREARARTRRTWALGIALGTGIALQRVLSP